MIEILPLNAISWFIGALMCASVGYRAFNGYRHNNNMYSLSMMLFFWTITPGFLCLSLPFVFTDNLEVIKNIQIFGQFWIYLALVSQSYAIWYSFFKSRVNKWIVVGPSIVLGVIASFSELTNEPITLTTQNIAEWNSPEIAVILEGLLVAMYIVPTGYVLLRESFRANRRRQKIKTLALGLVFFGVGAQQIMLNVFFEGNELLITTIANLALFTFAFLLSLLPSARSI